MNEFSGFENKTGVACHLISAIQVLKHFGFAHLPLEYYSNTFGIDIAKRGCPYQDLLKILSKTNTKLHSDILEGRNWVFNRRPHSIEKVEVCILMICRGRHCLVIRKINDKYFMFNDSNVKKMHKRAALKMINKFCYLADQK